MPKVEWGKKVVCLSCEAKFYDLNRKPAKCPHCGAEYVDQLVETTSINTKQVFTGNVENFTDNNLVGSDASESLAEVEDLELEDTIDDDTISLDDAENDVEVMNDEVDDLDLNENSSEAIEEN